MEFLQLFLTMLRARHFLDNTPITSMTWRDACRSPSNLLIVQSICYQCSSLRSFAARMLLTAPSVFPRQNCSYFRLDCYSAEELPIFSVAPNQWLMGVSAISSSSTPKLTDASPSFPVDALAIPLSAESIQPQPVE